MTSENVLMNFMPKETEMIFSLCILLKFVIHWPMSHILDKKGEILMISKFYRKISG